MIRNKHVNLHTINIAELVNLLKIKSTNVKILTIKKIHSLGKTI